MPGLAYPFGNSIKGVLDNKTTREAIATSIQNILLTPKGSLVYDPSFGSHVPMIVFEPISDAVINKLYAYIKQDVESQDSRVNITSMKIAVERKKIVVKLGYTEVNDQNQEQLQAAVTFSRNS